MQAAVVHVIEALVPLSHGLEVDGADAAAALPPQVGDQVPADETAGAGHQHDIVLELHRSIPICLAAVMLHGPNRSVLSQRRVPVSAHTPRLHGG
jgi:hypothetical protein